MYAFVSAPGFMRSSSGCVCVYVRACAVMPGCPHCSCRRGFACADFRLCVFGCALVGFSFFGACTWANTGVFVTRAKCSRCSEGLADPDRAARCADRRRRDELDEQRERHT